MGRGNSKQKMLLSDEYDFLLKNTNFNSDQILEWYDEFLQDCPNGQLTQDKFVEIYTQMFARENEVDNALNFCKHVFRSFDTDGNGYVDFTEFMLAVDISSMGSPKQKLAWAFRMYDINGDNFIEPNEMNEIIAAIYKMKHSTKPEEAHGSSLDLLEPQERTAAIFLKMDTDSDGRLTKDEFISGCLADEGLFKVLSNLGPNHS